MTGQQAGQALLANRYAVVGEIGRGGMGVVWRGEDRVIGRPVAIKELRLPDGIPAGEREVYTERVLREARTAGKLNDPAVITVYDVIQDRGTTYIVMELVEAETLADMLRRTGPLPPATVASIGRQVLSALQAAHAAGIVHRDVKPSNIMVSGNGRVKLTDFGIAQALDDPKLTVSGTVVGSPAFMAPERVAEQDVTPVADLWSLGATLFCAVEGYAPFERSSTAATLHAIMNEVPYLTRCQGPLASAIMGMLTANPRGRLPAQQVAGLLDLAVQQGQQPFDPTRQYTPPAPTRVAGAPRGGGPGRKKVGALVAAAVVLLGGAFAGGFFADRGLSGNDDPAMAPAMTYGPAGDLPRFSVSLNSSSHTCLSGSLRAGRRIGSDVTIECSSPHELELYGSIVSFEAPGSSSDKPDVAYPGREQLIDYTRAWCSLEFHSSKVTYRDKEDTLTYTVLVPTKQAWNGKGYSQAEHQSDFGTPQDLRQRTGYCVASARGGGQLSGSIYGKTD